MSARTPVDHRLRLLPHWFDLLDEGSKTQETRRNDRDFQIGDTITVGRCREDVMFSDSIYRKPCLGMCPDSKTITFRITHVLAGGQFGVEAGFAVLSLERLP